MSATSAMKQGVRPVIPYPGSSLAEVPQKIQAMDELSPAAQARLQRLTLDISKALVAGVRAVLAEEGRRNADMASDDPDTRLRTYMASVEAVDITGVNMFEREENTPYWESVLGPSAKKTNTSMATGRGRQP